MSIKETYRANIDTHIDCRLGTVADQSGNSNNGTFNGTPYFSRTNRGRALVMDGSTDFIDIGNAGGSIKSIVIVFQENDITANTDYLVDLNGTDYITVVNGTVTANGFGGATTNVFVNGVDGNTISNTTDVYHVTIVSDTGFTASDFDMGRLEGTGFFGGKILECITLTNELTAPEAAQLYEDSLQEGTYNKTPEKTSLPQLAAWNEFQQDSIWTKGTGWTIGNGKASSDGSQSADSDLTQVIGTVGLFYTIEYEISGYTAGNITALAGTAEGTDRAANGVYTEYATATGSGILGLRADLDFVGNVEWVRISEGAPLNYYADGRDWNITITASTAGFLENTGWTVASGTWQTDNTSTGAGLKHITCVANGSLSKPSEQAYGTWEFDVNKNVDADSIRVVLMSNIVGTLGTDTNSYYFAFNSSEQFELYRDTSGATLLIQSSDTFSLDTWYRIRITRDSSGEFTMYHSTDSGATYTQTTAGGGTTNPETDANHVTSSFTFINTLDASADIRNFKYLPVIQ